MNIHICIVTTIAKLPHQNGVRQLYIPLKSCIYVRPGCGDTAWYHHDLDRHIYEIFMEKYGAVQVCFGEVFFCVHRYICEYLSTI